jgi:hypothetical protein
MKEPAVNITKDILRLISEIDEFKGVWRAIGNLRPDRLRALKRIATIESVGSSTRIEGAKMTDQEVEALLTGIDTRSFRSGNEKLDAWLTFFLSCMKKQKDNLRVKIDREKLMAKLPALSGEIFACRQAAWSGGDFRYSGYYPGQPQYHQGAIA